MAATDVAFPGGPSAIGGGGLLCSRPCERLLIHFLLLSLFHSANALVLSDIKICIVFAHSILHNLLLNRPLLVVWSKSALFSIASKLNVLHCATNHRWKTKSATSGRHQPFIFALLPLAGLSWELVYSGPAKEHVCEGLKPGCSYQTRIYCLSEGGQSPVSHSALAHMHSPVSLATRIQKLWQPVGFFLLLLFLSQVINWQNWKLQTSAG